MRAIFWCEFPRQVDFGMLNKLVNFDVSIYFAVKSAKEFKDIKKKVKNKKINAGAWPILERKEGYWFSGFVSGDSIDKLDEFNGLDIKIDVEPPIYAGRHYLTRDFFWLAKYSLLKGRNNEYLYGKARKLNSRLILSGFLLPRFVRKRYGDYFDFGIKNYICYTTFFPIWCRRIARIILFNVIKRMSKKNFYAIGLANHGIFGNEPEYESIAEFKKDIDMMKRAGVKNLCVYSIEGILKRKDAGKWLGCVREFLEK